jgi:membrane associated rhomboid family serine protease
LKSSLSILLFFLLSGFFMALLVGLLLRNRRLLGLAGACFVAIACVLVFLHPVTLPRFGGKSYTTTTTTEHGGA